ncbi:MAG: ABC transporter permease [Roseburia sp.]|nr:ABC transporter permease [Roseburia sp.]MCM1278799.1 ABC transporter permease [Robinsoniella sp.]
MINLLKAEIYKLFYDKQFETVGVFIILYLLYSFLGIEKPVDFTFEGLLVSKTTDSVFMLFLIGIVGATVFTIDYSNKTYKNFLPYVRLKDVFIAKVFTNLIGSFLLLFLWYFTTCILAIALTKTFQINLLIPLFLRFFAQYLLILFHSSSIIIVGIITRNRAIASSFTIISWMLYTFIPINDGYFYDIIVSGYEWKKPNIIWLDFFFIIIYIVACFISKIIFERQEVRV